jgi:diaminohydroxyphosphoribosylaminopyrimidine deaminase/5-amino-6-(5-phosphoribosylamino)uracil reductase
MVIAKVAMSHDACVAAAPGVRTALTSAQANQRVQRTRARVDAVAVGSGTLLADDPRLDVRDVFRERPLVRAVFDRRLRTSPTARIFDTRASGPIVILTSAEAAASRPSAVTALEARGGAVVAEPDPALPNLLRRLVAFDVHAVLLEGGSVLHAAAFRDGVVDMVQAYVTPVELGPGGLPVAEALLKALPGLHGAHVEALGPDRVIEGYVHGTD